MSHINLCEADLTSPSLNFFRLVFILATPGRPELQWVFLERIVSVIILAPTSGLVSFGGYFLLQNPIQSTNKIELVAESHKQLVKATSCLWP